MINYLKYNIPAPRYTSYPTVPYWNHEIKVQDDWIKMVQQTFSETNHTEGISIYIHLPFCESLCTYCGCNRYITKNHSVEVSYINSLLKEWELYKMNFSEEPVIREFHLGGGTPTFFHPKQLERLISGIIGNSVMAVHHEFSFEAHPASTTKEHLSTLHRLGFNRISLGIQDFDTAVQKKINRIQTFEQIQNITEGARNTGYSSVNYDLIYGLPLQNEKSIRLTMQKVKELKPDRIAFYSYAHVPWLKTAQKSLEPFLPSQEQKMSLHLLGRELMKDAGYEEVGMDHFALPEDELFTAFREKRLHRNFMGYTSHPSKLLLGLGASSISDSSLGFIQNEREPESYEKVVTKNILPIINSHKMSNEDKRVRQQILDLMCKMETEMDEDEHFKQEKIINQMKNMQDEGLIGITATKIKVLPLGKLFLRNICLLFDRYYWKSGKREKKFSQVV